MGGLATEDLGDVVVVEVVEDIGDGVGHGEVKPLVLAQRRRAPRNGHAIVLGAILGPGLGELDVVPLLRVIDGQDLTGGAIH